MRELKPFIPCLFDIPFKDALTILGCSHHTLDPIRRAMNLDRWPFLEIVHGRFSYDRNQIVALRAQMMSHASEDMQKCLCLAATRAEECWRSGKPKRRAPVQKDKGYSPTDSIAPPPCSPSEPSQEEHGIFGPDDNDEGDEAFWNDMREFFHLREAVTPSWGQ